MMKFWNAASWSNFSAHRPAIRPSEPNKVPPSTAKVSVHHGSDMPGQENQAVTAKTPNPTTSPRTSEAPT